MRAFILGAGFSKAAGLPLTIELTALVFARLSSQHHGNHPREWMSWLRAAETMAGWFAGGKTSPPENINIEELFYLAETIAEVEFSKQHECQVGRFDGSTPFSDAESVDGQLDRLEEELRCVFFEQERNPELDLSPINRFCASLRPGDAILTFNYDRLVERSLTASGTPVTPTLLGFESQRPADTPCLLKLHGSIDWELWQRGSNPKKNATLLYRKPNENLHDRNAAPSEHAEDRWDLYRMDASVAFEVAANSDLQVEGRQHLRGLAGLGHRKRISQVPGLGRLWRHAADALQTADRIIIVGFAMSPFDRFASHVIASQMAARKQRNRPDPEVLVIAPDAASRIDDYRRVFPTARAVETCHERIEDWAVVLGL